MAFQGTEKNCDLCVLVLYNQIHLQRLIQIAMIMFSRRVGDLWSRGLIGKCFLVTLN